MTTKCPECGGNPEVDDLYERLAEVERVRESWRILATKANEVRNAAIRERDEARAHLEDAETQARELNTEANKLHGQLREAREALRKREETIASLCNILESAAQVIRDAELDDDGECADVLALVAEARAALQPQGGEVRTGFDAYFAERMKSPTFAAEYEKARAELAAPSPAPSVDVAYPCPHDCNHGMEGCPPAPPARVTSVIPSSPLSPEERRDRRERISPTPRLPEDDSPAGLSACTCRDGHPYNMSCPEHPAPPARAEVPRMVLRFSGPGVCPPNCSTCAFLGLKE